MKPAVRRSVLVSVPALIVVLGGCSIHEQSQQWNPRYDGVTAEAGDIGLRNVLVVKSTDNRATVLTSFANRGESDELVEVRIGEQAGTPANGALEIPQSGYAALEPGADQIEIGDVELHAGQMTDVEFRFANAPRVTVQAVVKDAEDRYAEVSFSEPAEPENQDPAGTEDGATGDGTSDTSTDAGTEDGAETGAEDEATEDGAANDSTSDDADTSTEEPTEGDGTSDNASTDH